MRIGVFDSGLGGLTVLKELRAEIPEASFVYLGDTARTPYGSKSASTIQRYAEECTAFLDSHAIDLLVVACNTASALAFDVIKKRAECAVIGTIEPAVSACIKLNPSSSVAVVGTRATITSGVYEKALQQHAPHLKVHSIACPLFVPLVEEGLWDGPIVHEMVRHYLDPLKSQGVEALILACTHYPLLAKAIAANIGPAVSIVECSRAIATTARTLLGNPTGGRGVGEVQFFATDEISRFNALARTLLPEVTVQAVHVEALAL